jgi:hypothetical protein
LVDLLARDARKFIQSPVEVERWND